MKRFNLGVQKWTLTACLIAALGFSVSHNAHIDGYAAADFASESSVVRGEIDTAEGAAPVQFVIDGEDVSAIAKFDTQGQLCIGDCKKEVISIPKSLLKGQKDITSLKSAFLKYLKEKSADETLVAKKPSKKIVATESADEEEEIVAVAVSPKKSDQIGKHLKDIVKKCLAKTSKNDTHELMNCKAQGLVDLMQRIKDPSKRTIDRFNRFYADHIEKAISAEIANAKRITAILRRGGDLSPKDSAKDPEDIHKATLETIELLLGETPTKFESLRKRIVATEVVLTSKEAQAIQDAFIEAKNNNNPRQEMAAKVRARDFLSLIGTLQETTHSSLQTAAELPGANVSKIDGYFTDFNQFAEKLKLSIARNPYNFEIPASNLANSIASLESEIISRDETETNTDARRVRRAADRSGRANSPFANLNPRANITPPTTPGVVFGPVTQATAAEIAARNAARNK